MTHAQYIPTEVNLYYDHRPIETKEDSGTGKPVVTEEL